MSSLLKKLLIVALAAPTFAFAQTSVDKVVATVAGEPITAQQVQERITVNVGLVNRDAGKAVKLTKAQQDQIAQGSFNELIEERVLLNRAKTVAQNYGIEATPSVFVDGKYKLNYGQGMVEFKDTGAAINSLIAKARSERNKK